MVPSKPVFKYPKEIDQRYFEKGIRENFHKSMVSAHGEVLKKLCVVTFLKSKA